MSFFTGLSTEYLEQTDLHIHPLRFAKELLREEEKSVGRLNSRYLGIDFDIAGERYDSDPGMYGMTGAHNAAALSYLSEVLKVDMGKARYVVVNRSGLQQNWDWSMPDNGRWTLGMGTNWPIHVNVAPYLGDEMRRNKNFRVLLANGYFDLGTPFFATENSMYQSGMLPERVTFTYYQAGHMMYVRRPSLEKLSNDMHDFILQGR